MVLLHSGADNEALGCRSMTRRLREEYYVMVTRDAVSAAQRRVDLASVLGGRKRRLVRREYIVDGPNAMWHFDQNDKLRQFGFEIHGCIDGWSCRMLW